MCSNLYRYSCCIDFSVFYCILFVFFFKQKTAYEMRISDWSSDVCSSDLCSGSFLLAESGLLDGHRAPTSWWLGPMFRQRYPNVTLDESRMIVNSTRFTTAGAALAPVDLALRIIRGRSPALADRKSTRLNSSHSCATRMPP